MISDDFPRLPVLVAAVNRDSPALCWGVRRTECAVDRTLALAAISTGQTAATTVGHDTLADAVVTPSPFTAQQQGVLQLQPLRLRPEGLLPGSGPRRGVWSNSPCTAYDSVHSLGRSVGISPTRYRGGSRGEAAKR